MSVSSGDSIADPNAAHHVAPEDVGAFAPPEGDVADFGALEGMANVLMSSGKYRVLRRFQPRRRYCEAEGVATKTALFVDVESTGLDTANDAIIEFAAVPFTFDPKTGRIHDVRPAVVALEDPGRPIPREVVELTGITEDMVRGRRIDDALIDGLLRDVCLVVAHNAGFDRPMVERRFPAFAGLHWACSHAEVPWPKLGCRGSKLDYLLFQRCAEFFAGHRADEDCLAAIHVLATPHTDGTIPFQLLLESARTPTHRVWAVGAPFETKDALKARRYRFFGGPGPHAKTWYRDCTPSELDEELTWLKAHCCPHASVDELRRHLQKFTAKDRYSTRMA